SPQRGALPLPRERQLPAAAFPERERDVGRTGPQTVGQEERAGRGVPDADAVLAVAVPVAGERPAVRRAEAEAEVGGAGGERVAQQEQAARRIVEADAVVTVAVPV